MIEEKLLHPPIIFELPENIEFIPHDKVATPQQIILLTPPTTEEPYVNDLLPHPPTTDEYIPVE
jgi:hypothetical protein